MNENECYIEYLDKDNQFQKTHKDFKTYESANAWMMEHLANPHPDMIKFHI